VEISVCTHIGVFFMVCDNDVAFMDCVHLFYTLITKWSVYKCTMPTTGNWAAIYSSARLRWHCGADLNWCGRFYFCRWLVSIKLT